MFLLFVSLHEPLPWGKLFPEISGEPMSLGSGSHEDFGWWHWSHWNVLCCPWGLAPAWRGVGLSDLCSSQFKVFLLLILFATRGPWGECSWVSGLGQGSLSRAHPPLRREPREKCKLWWVKEGKKQPRPFSWGCFASFCPCARESRFLYFEGPRQP